MNGKEKLRMILRSSWWSRLGPQGLKSSRNLLKVSIEKWTLYLYINYFISMTLLENHPYDVCEVITTSIEGGNKEYLDWIGKVVPLQKWASTESVILTFWVVFCVPPNNEIKLVHFCIVLPHSNNNRRCRVSFLASCLYQFILLTILISEN